VRLCQDDCTKPLPKLNVVSQAVVKYVGSVEVFVPLLLCILPVLLIRVMGPTVLDMLEVFRAICASTLATALVDWLLTRGILTYVPHESG